MPVEVGLGANPEGLRTGLAEAKEALTEFREEFAGEMGGAFAGAIEIGAITEAAASMFELGHHLQDLHEKFDVSTDDLQKFGFAAKQNGVDLDTVAMAFNRLEVARSKAEQGQKTYVEAFAHLGISVEQLKALSPEELMVALGQSSMEAADMVEILGRNALNLVPTLKQVADGSASVAEIMDQKTVKSLSDANKAILDFQNSLTVFEGGVAAKLAPGIEGFDELLKVSERLKLSWGDTVALFAGVQVDALMGKQIPILLPSDRPEAEQEASKFDSNAFNTKLSPEEESAFQAWKATYAPTDSGDDYDLRGAFKAGVTPDGVRGHFPDTFKKPNHPTFSDESMYSTGKYRGGHWGGDDSFTASETNLQFHGASELRDYFKKVEPDSQLNLPGDQSLRKTLDDLAEKAAEKRKTIEEQITAEKAKQGDLIKQHQQEDDPEKQKELLKEVQTSGEQIIRLQAEGDRAHEESVRKANAERERAEHEYLRSQQEYWREKEENQKREDEVAISLEQNPEKKKGLIDQQITATNQQVEDLKRNLANWQVESPEGGPFIEDAKKQLLDLEQELSRLQGEKASVVRGEEHTARHELTPYDSMSQVGARLAGVHYQSAGSGDHQAKENARNISELARNVQMIRENGFSSSTTSNSGYATSVGGF